MNNFTKTDLDKKLKEMLTHFDRAEARQKEKLDPIGKGNVIHRRKGKKDKRFSINTESA